MSSVSDDEISVVVVARHGERLDYVSRDAGTNWVATAAKPFDPPLTEHGKEQAVKLGQHLASELKRLQYPKISAIYTSPFLRCRQTSIGVQKALQAKGSRSFSDDATPPPVRVELGLAESINEQWYCSWSLPESDGTWGFRVHGDKAFDTDTLHPLAKQPVQALLGEWTTDETLDLSYNSKTSITEPYCFYPPNLETRMQQRLRMKQVVTSVSEPGQTVVLVSHGGPVTHLYEELTGNSWHVHGESTYCCYSIYTKRSSNNGVWEPMRVNKSNYLHENLIGDHYVSDTEA